VLADRAASGSRLRARSRRPKRGGAPVVENRPGDPMDAPSPQPTRSVVQAGGRGRGRGFRAAGMKSGWAPAARRSSRPGASPSCCGPDSCTASWRSRRRGPRSPKPCAWPFPRCRRPAARPRRDRRRRRRGRSGTERDQGGGVRSCGRRSCARPAAVIIVVDDTKLSPRLARTGQCGRGDAIWLAQPGPLPGVARRGVTIRQDDRGAQFVTDSGT